MLKNQKIYSIITNITQTNTTLQIKRAKKQFFNANIRLSGLSGLSNPSICSDLSGVRTRFKAQQESLRYWWGVESFTSQVLVGRIKKVGDITAPRRERFRQEASW